MINKKIIEHPLRQIALEFDADKPEQPYEEEVVKSYIGLHDLMLSLDQERTDLQKKFHHFEKQISDVEQNHHRLKEKIDALYERAESIIRTKEGSSTLINSFIDECNSVNPLIGDFDDQMREFADKASALYDDYNTYYHKDEDSEEAFVKHSDLCHELFHNYNNYSLDIVSYSDDDDAFKGRLTPITNEQHKFFEQANNFFDRYEALMENVSANYDRMKKLNEMLETIIPGEYLMDTSLSESFIGKPENTPGRPVYFIPPGSPSIAVHRDQISNIAALANPTISFHFPVAEVQRMNIAPLLEMMMVFQHYPALIERMIFAVDVVFEEIEGSELLLQEDDWKGQPEFVRWFNELNKFPPAIFFLNDSDARQYVIMGDLIYDENHAKVQSTGRKKEKVEMDATAMQEVANRLFDACVHMLYYCHNLGFNPDPYIDAILADFNLSISLEDVHKEYERRIAEGIRLKKN